MPSTDYYCTKEGRIGLLVGSQQNRCTPYEYLMYNGTRFMTVCGCCQHGRHETTGHKPAPDSFVNNSVIHSSLIMRCGVRGTRYLERRSRSTLCWGTLGATLATGETLLVMKMSHVSSRLCDACAGFAPGQRQSPRHRTEVKPSLSRFWAAPRSGCC